MKRGEVCAPIFTTRAGIATQVPLGTLSSTRMESLNRSLKVRWPSRTDAPGQR